MGIEDDVSQFRGNSTMPKPDSTWDLSLSTSTSATRSLHNNVLSNQDPAHFADDECKAAKMTKKVVHASPAAAFKRLLGKSSEKEDMWVFVS